jgi:hypothetical protein
MAGPRDGEARRLAGLDTRATKILAAVLDADTGELELFASGANTSEAAFCPGSRNGAAARPPLCSKALRCVQRCAGGPQLEMSPFGTDDSDASDLDTATAALRVAG